jgi:hypothetical protein
LLHLFPIVKSIFFAVKYLDEVCHKISNVMLIVFKVTFGQHLNFKYLKQKKKKCSEEMQSPPDTKTVKNMTGDFFANETKLCKKCSKKLHLDFLQRSIFTIWSSISFNID